MKNVLVLFGGCSSEHDVSVVSASSVIANIDKEKYNIYMMGITKDGAWYLYEGPVEELPGDRWVFADRLTRACLSPDRAVHGITVFEEDVPRNIRMDVAFPVLHGKNGEDGTVQGLLQLAGIPFVGCGMTASAVAMDKIFSNIVADRFGIAQAKWDYITRYEYESGEKSLAGIASTLGYPIFVKPANAGSSVGISKAKNPEELEAATKLALQHDSRILFEEFIDCFECECAVLGNDVLTTGIIGQVTPVNEFYDYDAKYIDAGSELHIPALVDEKTRELVAENAKKIFRAIGCTGFSRADFFVEKATGRVLFNEINTIPGFTSISMYPKMIEAAGITYSELCDRLIALAEENSSF